MSRKRMLADVLWEAANVHLPDVTFSCWAVDMALRGVDVFMRAPRFAFHFEGGGAPWEFLRSMDEECHLDSGPMTRNDITDPLGSKGVRYMWLLLAMHVAEDEGIAT